MAINDAQPCTVVSVNSFWKITTNKYKTRAQIWGPIYDASFKGLYEKEVMPSSANLSFCEKDTWFLRQPPPYKFNPVCLKPSQLMSPCT